MTHSAKTPPGSNHLHNRVEARLVVQSPKTDFVLTGVLHFAKGHLFKLGVQKVLWFSSMG
eukprot:555999-Amphidinium_carterae.1